MDSKITVQLEEVSIEKVCRTCLNTAGDDTMISIYDEELTNKLNFFEIINETFGKIVRNLIKLTCSCIRIYLILDAFYTKFTKSFM